jgi:tRNA(Ile)-lysidine synthase
VWSSDEQGPKKKMQMENQLIISCLQSFSKMVETINGKKNVLVACSGGNDSMGLLGIMYLALQNKLIDKLVVAHINHHLREESDIDEQCVVSFCMDRSIPVFVRHTDETEINSYKLGTEAGARMIRYKFLDGLLANHKLNVLVTGHHAQDRLETMLYRIGQASAGLLSIAAISEKRVYTSVYEHNKIITENDNVYIVRPMIRFWPTEIEEMRNDMDISFAQDISNFSNDYLRNKYRNLVIPQIKEISDQRSIERSLHQIHEDAELFMYLVEEKKSQCIIEKKDNLLIVDANILGSYPEKLQLSIIHLLNRELNRTERFGEKFIRAIADTVANRKNKKRAEALSRKRRVDLVGDRLYMIFTGDSDPKKVKHTDYI